MDESIFELMAVVYFPNIIMNYNGIYQNDNMIELANKMYNRNYLSVSREKMKNGDGLVFKGANTEMTILEVEFEYNADREFRRFEKYTGTSTLTYKGVEKIIEIQIGHENN